MTSLLEKIKKQSRITGTDIRAESEFFKDIELISTDVPMLNVAFSGDLDGGLAPGHNMFAGPSKHFKTSFALLAAGAYLKKKEDSVLLFYDSEFGSPQDYFKSFGIDPGRVIHTPVMNIEELKFDLIHQLENIEKKDNVIIIIDSIGNVASKKEVEDAKNESSKADMTRAKALKSLFRMITPYLKTKNIPLITINHIYMEQGLFPKAIVSGGTGAYYSADNIWIVGRRQDKSGKEIQGYHFVIRVEKSRFVRENSKIPISVSWEKGISKWSGLLDIALESGWVKKPKQGWYAVWDRENDCAIGKSFREADTDCKEFWQPILGDPEFQAWISHRYKISTQDMLEDADLDDLLNEED